MKELLTYVARNLVDNPDLRYEGLCEFDRAMVDLLKKNRLMNTAAVNRWLHQDDKVIIYTKGDTVFAFNLHPTKSFDGYFVPVGRTGTYSVALNTDDVRFGGHGRVDTSVNYEAEALQNGTIGFKCYLPSRSAIVLRRKR